MSTCASPCVLDLSSLAISGPSSTPVSSASSSSCSSRALIPHLRGASACAGRHFLHAKARPEFRDSARLRAVTELFPTLEVEVEEVIDDTPAASSSKPKKGEAALLSKQDQLVCQDAQGKEEEWSLMRVVQKCAVCLMASVTLASFEPVSSPAHAFTTSHIFDEFAILISGPPVKDPSALLRYALPADTKSIKDVQKSLEDITDSLKLGGAKAFDPVERNVRQAARALSQNKSAIIASLAPAKKEAGQDLLDKLTVGLQDLQKIVEDKERDAIAPKQRELLYLVGDVEEAMVDKFPFEVPEEYANKPLLKGRATVEMKIKVKDNPNLKDIVFQMVLDGYNAPVTAGNFVDLVERHFYDGVEIQRADGFVVQTGDPDGPAEGFVDPSTEKIRTIPLEIMVDGDKQPIYEATLEELGRYKASTKLPFNAFGTLAMAREEFDNNSASSQIFWLLKESELTPSNANILDGRYAVFGYVTENEELLADLKVGDVIESMKVVSGLDNLVNPSYKIS